jgi:16S rRNA (uracil1498-N3)-methyltransferase
MPRFYLHPEQWLLPEPRLDGADAHHAAHVLRCEVGTTIVVFNGQGTEAIATITGLEKKKPFHATLSLGARRETPPPHCQLTLAQAIPKAKNMDLIIQKGVELGVTRMIPLLSERTILRCADPRDALQKQERWQQIALEACKQSGQNWLPRVEKPCSFQDFFKNLSLQQDQLLLIASLESQKQSLKAVLSSRLATSSVPTKVTMMIGPEGDFTSKEYAAAKDFGFQPIGLGPIILRTETAAIYCLSVLSYELHPF